jgi:hypothetical protein
LAVVSYINNLSSKHLKFVHAMKEYRESRGIAPLILTLALEGGEWSASRPGRFTHATGAGYPLNRRLGGPQSRFGHFG